MKMIKTVLTCVLICILSFTTACQPTPEKQVVINKIDSLLDELVLENADPNEAWPHTEDRILWSETKTVDIDNEMSDEYTVSVNIDAEMPDDPGKVPMVVIEPQYSDIELLKAAKYLLQGEIFVGTPSKQDVTAEILDFKQEVSAHSIIDGYQGQVDEHLEFLNEKYENATDGNNKAEFEFEVIDGFRGLRLKSYPDDGNIMKFTASASRFYFYNREFNKSYTNLVNAPDENIQANGIKTTYEQAKAIADEAMKAIFSEPFAMVHSNILDKVNDWEYLWNDGEETSLGQSYVFYFSPEYSGFASLFIDYAPIVGTDEKRYTESYPREYVSLIVDDNGIVNMHYESFSKAVETINDDVRLMPFADILERFKNEVF